MIGQDIQVAHLASNSHSEMIKSAGWRDNEPNRKILVFEAEWNGEGELPPDTKLIRNCGECPEKVKSRIKAHYQKLKEALETGRHLDGYFADADKWGDILTEAMNRGHAFDFSKVVSLGGTVYVREGATFTAPVLTKCGTVDVRKGATFTAPVLPEVSGYVDVREGATFTAPVLTEVSGYVNVMEGATFTAPVLTKCGSVDVQKGATFTAPVLTEVSSSVYVRECATFTAPVLTKCGTVYVQKGATFTAPKLKK